MYKKILADFSNEAFESAIIHWFHREKRDLPWRKTKDPYHIWVSEIMLQQTRVETVIPYYYNFLEKFPTIEALARADTDDVLKAWEGLGYYSRARNLQHAARDVVKLYNGIVPANKALLGKLKGIGPYTRGAILSIAFGQPEPAVDGNVMRVLSRILHIEEDIAIQRNRKIFEGVAGELITKQDPSAFTQGLMELGATVCTPTKPACLLCPVASYCRAFELGIEESLPIKSKAKRKKQLYYAALLIRDQKNRVLIEKRANEGLLAGLWQFPMVETKKVDFEILEEEIGEEVGLPIKIKTEVHALKHVFTHLVWHVKAYEAVCENNDLIDERFRFVSIETLDDYAFPVSHQKLMPFIQTKSSSSLED